MWSAVGANILAIFVRFKLFEIFTIPELFLQSYTIIAGIVCGRDLS